MNPGLASHADLRHALYPANHSRTFFCWRGYVADSESSFAYLDARNLPDEYTGDCASAARSHELQGFIESPPGSKSGAYCLGCPPLERPATHKVEVLLPVAGAPSDLSTATLRQILDAFLAYLKSMAIVHGQPDEWFPPKDADVAAGPPTGNHSFTVVNVVARRRIYRRAGRRCRRAM